MAENNSGQISSASGIPIKDIYTPEDVKNINYEKEIGAPGKPPYTRGVYASMYRGQLWTIRRLTGYDSPEATNARYKEEYALGQTGFSIAPDISTPSGMDPDDPRVAHDIGHAGVPIYSIEDMETVFKDLPIEKCSAYLADRVGGLLTPAYFAMARKRGIPLDQVRGTTANDMLTWSSMELANQPPPEAYFRLSTDLIEWCAQYAPRWYPISMNSYNPRDNGITAVQELGMLMADVIQYCDEGKRRGRVPLDKFCKRFAFNMAANNDLFEETCKLRAARRMLRKIINERFGVQDPACGQFRVHVQTSGSSHTHQEPLNNVIRIAYQTLAAVLGGAQSIHANGYDEAVCLPTEQAMLLAIRTEQIVGLETGVTNTIDPLGGSYYVEALTNEIESRTWDYIKKIEDQGGLLKAITNGWIHREYKQAIIDYDRKLKTGELTIIGVNKFRLDPDKVPYKVPIFKSDRSSVEVLKKRIKKLRETRDNARHAQAMKKLDEVLRSDANTFPAVTEAVEAHATPGELGAAVMKVYGKWTYPIGV
ncbi:MAG: methylmalonyl-CoA mutase [Methanothrix sp.]|jgi:methylmalonyl-CoA mutase N-terminal domain/subunit|nr:MAG: methylmalonyl-CoA mutase [Methanothrix sp.]